MIAQLCVFDKNHSTVHFKQANVFTTKLLKKQQSNISNFTWFNLICARSCAVKVAHMLSRSRVRYSPISQMQPSGTGRSRAKVSDEVRCPVHISLVPEWVPGPLGSSPGPCLSSQSCRSPDCPTVHHCPAPSVCPPTEE